MDREKRKSRQSRKEQNSKIKNGRGEYREGTSRNESDRDMERGDGIRDSNKERMTEIGH